MKRVVAPQQHLVRALAPVERAELGAPVESEAAEELGLAASEGLEVWDLGDAEALAWEALGEGPAAWVELEAPAERAIAVPANVDLNLRLTRSRAITSIPTTQPLPQLRDSLVLKKHTERRK
jgi:hypothetical protein